MFEFNFLSENEEHIREDATDLVQSQPVFLESKEILVKNILNSISSSLNEVDTKIIECDHLKIKYLCSNSLMKFLRNQDLVEESIIKADQNHSDLLPAVYEGGLKIWECTYDLLNHFKDSNNNFENKTVLDLGCGAGILGIFSLLKGATCWFQDYNSDVINNVTIPNVILNSKEFLEKTKFFSGDWDSFADIAEKNYQCYNFDYIITSETIYNTSYYKKLHLVFEKFLKKDGIIFVAAKTFYFGVGGGIHLFQDFLKSKKIFKYTSCWQSIEGVKREILKLEFL